MRATFSSAVQTRALGVIEYAARLGIHPTLQSSRNAKRGAG
jgi:hypothetical protein